jgi:hypothetical protein
MATQLHKGGGLKVGGVYFTGLLILPFQGLGHSPVPMLTEVFILSVRFNNPVICISSFLQRRPLIQLPSSRCLAQSERVASYSDSAE